MTLIDSHCHLDFLTSLATSINLSGARAPPASNA
jgi:hypothetical protein